MICNSQTYQRTSQTTSQNERDEELFSHQQVRLLTAEQLMDAIGYLTGQLTSVETINQVIRQLRNKASVIKQEIHHNQPDWEAEQQDSLAKTAFFQGSWWHVGPYGKDHGHKLNHADEALIKARYVYTRIYANQPLRVLMQCSADDGMKVWHDNRVVFENPQLETPEKNQTTEVSLHKGWNRFLIKVTNKGGAYRFRFNLEYLDEGNGLNFTPIDVAGYAAEILRTPPEQRTLQQGKLLRSYYIEQDGRLPKIQKQISNSGRMDFATQRPYPIRSGFLKAFGQPQRASPCVCERESEPTLEQALQLLNGQTVYERVMDSVEVFENLKNTPLVDQLYYTAFSRNASSEERQVIEKYLTDTENRNDAIQDVVWAIINSQEFMFQH